MMYCNPDVCPYCQYIGEGDSLCEETGEIVLEDWEPTKYNMGSGCPFQTKKKKSKKRRKKMAQVKIKCGRLEMTANGNTELIAQERGAFIDYLRSRTTDELPDAQDLREKMAAMKSKHEVESPLSYNMRAFRPMHITPAMLKQAKDEECLDKLIEPFDEIDVPIDTGGTVTFVCGFSSSTSARFVMKDCWDKAQMNKVATDNGGYFKSYGRAHILEDIWPHVAPEWQAIVKPRTIVEITDGQRREYADPMWLLSATDVFGLSENGCWKDDDDSLQLAIFKNWRYRIKECGDGEPYPYWTRSVYATNMANFRFVNTNGGVYDNIACISYGFAPGFDV